MWLVLKFMSVSAKLWLGRHPSLQAAVATCVAVDIATNKRTCELVGCRGASRLRHSKELGVWRGLLTSTTMVTRRDIRELYRVTKREIVA